MRKKSLPPQHYTDNILQQAKQAAEETSAKCVIDEHCREEIDKVNSELKHCQLKNEFLADICNGLSVEIADLNQKVENMELNVSKRSIMLAGWRLKNAKKDDAIMELENFFDQKLNAAVVIDDYFYLGQSIVVEFQCTADKRLVMRNKSSLKDSHPNVFINEYTPIQTAEKRKREKFIIKQLEEVGNSEGTEIKTEFTQAGLTVQGVPYRKQVQPPSPKELINLSLTELDKVLKIKMLKGKVIHKDGSKFLAYSAPASTHQEVREMYMKLKLTRPEARHVVCAYMLPGPIHVSHDFHDDGEHGGGRTLLQFMEEKNMVNSAVFVIRKYGGVKLGPARFECYRQAVNSMLQVKLDQSSASIETQYVPPDNSNRYQQRQQRQQQQSRPRNQRNRQQHHYNQRQITEQRHPYYPRHSTPRVNGDAYNRGAAAVRRPYRSTQQPPPRRQSRYEDLMGQNQNFDDRLFTFTNPDPNHRIRDWAAEAEHGHRATNV